MTEIHLDPDLRDELAERIEGTNFESVDEYVEFVLKEVFASDDETDASDDPERERDLGEQLDALGYT